MAQAAFIACILFLSSRCYYDSEEYLFPKPAGDCDTTNVTFSLSVQPVLQTYCYSCHSNANSSFGGNIRLEAYADVKVRADDGSLAGSIQHLPPYLPMPQGASKLEPCKITLIKKWIEVGSPNN